MCSNPGIITRVYNMDLLRSLAPVLSILACLVTAVSTTFTVVFAVVFTQASLDLAIPAIIASAMNALFLPILALCISRRPCCFRDGHTGDQLRGSPALQASAAILSLLGIAATLTTLVWMEIRFSDLPRSIIGAPTQHLLLAGFMIWGATIMSTVPLITVLFLYHHPDTVARARLSRTETWSHESPEMRDRNAQSFTAGDPVEENHLNPLGQPLDRDRRSSDTLKSFRSSLSYVVRPMTSKTRLLAPSTPFRRELNNSRLSTATVHDDFQSANVDNGFDTWDTSAVPCYALFPLEITAPVSTTMTAQRRRSHCLETIPGSPAVSRTPSPGCPLDVDHASQTRPGRRLSRSMSPYPRIPGISQGLMRPASYTDITQAHIHPLFRSNSPGGAPPASPGTTVTAAPGAGQTIPTSELESIISLRSMRRLRAESRPVSPLSMKGSMDGSEPSEDTEWPPEREMTPPIPDFVMAAEARGSLASHSWEKVLGPVRGSRASQGKPIEPW